MILIILALEMLTYTANSATFTLKYGTTPLTSIDVYVYQNGKQVASGSTTSTGIINFTLAAGNYSYKTETNFGGNITATSVVLLDHKKLTFTVTDNENNPIGSEIVRVFEDGIEVSNAYTNSSGLAVFYLKPSEKYAYKTSIGQASISLLNDTSINYKKNDVKVSVIAKYLNYPIADNFTIYSIVNKNSSLASASSSGTNGEVSFRLLAGNYLLKNKLDIYTELNISNANQQVFLDYKKVRFISNKSDPNVLANITVSNGSYSTESKITDGKGYADFYLLPGAYSYTHYGSSESLIITNDTIIESTTRLVTIDLNSASSTINSSDQSFKMGRDMDNLSSYKTDLSGTCKINLKVGKYVFSDGVSGFTFSVNESTTIINPPLFDVTFNITQNFPEAKLDYIYLTFINTGKIVSYSYPTSGIKLRLLLGEYNLRCSGNGFSSSYLLPFTVAQNTIIVGFYRFQLNLSDNNGAAVPDQNYYIKQDGNYILTTFKTNNQGVATALLPNGNYQLYNPINQEETSFVIKNQNIVLNQNLPNEVSLTVTKDGQPYTGYIVYYKEGVNTKFIQIIDGVGKERLLVGAEYSCYLNTLGLSNPLLSDFTVTNDKLALDFVSVQINSQGKGLTFPYQFYEKSISCLLKGHIIRLVAIPMQGWTCKWNINGTIVSDDMIDYTLNDKILATAIFSQEIGNALSNDVISQNITLFPNPTQSQINFSEILNGNVIIYKADGVKVKQLHVVGNGINVSDLESGLYIMTIETESKILKGTFVKN